MTFYKKLMGNYNIIRILGRGSYGTVELIEHKQTKELAALKTIIINKSEEVNDVINEIKIMSKLNSKYVVKIFDWAHEQNKFLIIMEWAQKGDLNNLINEHIEIKKLIDSKILDKIIYQTTCGIKDLHDQQIIHRDIKPSNILLFDDYNVKLADFGVSKFMLSNVNAYTQVGTPYYMSPEIINGYSYSYSADYWALGCVFYELLTLTKPFNGSNILALFYKIMNGNYDSNKLPSKYKNLVKSLIKVDKTKRFNYKHIFNFYIKITF